MPSTNPPIIHRLLLDTHANFPPNHPPSTTASNSTTPSTTTSTTTSTTQTSLRNATHTWSLSPPAQLALSLLPSPPDRAKALRFFKPSDAALSLGSSLLKHAAITRALPRETVGWSRSLVTQERHIRNGKPFFAKGGVEFNASHHGRLVVLGYAVDGEGGMGGDLGPQPEVGTEIGSGTGSGTGTGTGPATGTGPKSPSTDPPRPAPLKAPAVGVDVVHVDMTRGRRDISRSGGWRAWSSIFSEAFTPGEVEAIGRAMDGSASTDTSTGSADDIPDALLERALRTFYTYWSLKEAYIKMTSEAFMADWLRVLEFRNVRIPGVAAAAMATSTVGAPSGTGEEEEEDGEDGTWTQAEPVRDIEVWLRGVRLEDVYVEIQCVGRWYMVATAVGARRARIAELEEVRVERDLVGLARS